MAREREFGEKQVAGVTFAEFWRVLEPVLRARHNPSTLRTEAGRYEILAAHFGETAIKQVGASEVEDFVAYLRNDRGASPATCNRYLSLLGFAFREAAARSFAEASPVREVKRVREELKPVPYLAPADLDRLIAASPEHFRPLVVLATDTGLRRGELAALEWRDVDLAAGTVVVRRSKAKRPRQVPLTQRAAEALADLSDRRGPVPLVGPDPVFPGYGGKAVDRITGAFRRVARRAGFRTLSFHDLRHGYASALVRAGVPIPTVAVLLGHSPNSIGVTMRYARHAPQGAEFEAVRMLEGRSVSLGPLLGVR